MPITRTPPYNMPPTPYSYAQVTPMQITRAFLVRCNSNHGPASCHLLNLTPFAQASLHMTPDSLGARVIESKHTGCVHA